MLPRARTECYVWLPGQDNDARIREVSTLMTGVCGKLDQKFMEQIAGASDRLRRALSKTRQFW